MVHSVANKGAAVKDGRDFAPSSRYELPIVHKNDNLLIHARLLHEKLKVKHRFDDWIRNRIREYGFEENKDFLVFPEILGKPKGGRPRKEYYFTLDTGKELAMVERNEVGRAVRRYFIQVEKELRSKRLYAATATITELSKTIKPLVLNKRRMFDFRAAQAALGFSTKGSVSNVRKAGYAGLVVVFQGKSYVAEEYLKVMMASAKTRALRAEAKASRPVLPPNFGQLTLNMEGGEQ